MAPAGENAPSWKRPCLAPRHHVSPAARLVLNCPQKVDAPHPRAQAVICCGGRRVASVRRRCAARGSQRGLDIAFLNAELRGVGNPPIATERVVDTLLARRKHPGGHNTLDDLCSRYGVYSLRSKHGALLDAELLAAVYVELTTTRQAALQLEPIIAAPSNVQAIVRVRRLPLPPRVTADDRNAHREFVRTLGKDAVWRDYFTIRSTRAA